MGRCLSYCLALSPPLSLSPSLTLLSTSFSLFFGETAADSSHLSGVATTLQASRPTLDIFFSALVNTRLKIGFPSNIAIRFLNVRLRVLSQVNDCCRYNMLSFERGSKEVGSIYI